MSRSAVLDSEGAFLLEQDIGYAYDQPIRRLRHRLMVLPRAAHGSQVRTDFGISVSDCSADVEVLTDGFSNTVVQVDIESVPQRVEFSTWSFVTCRPDRISTEPRELIRRGQLLSSTRLTKAGATLAGVGRQMAGIEHHPVAIGEMACTWVSRAMTYEYGATNVRTSAEEALAVGRGVCQDYAHVMIAICRAAGVPARYVSGHLVGEGGSHAWVEVMAPTSSGVGVTPVGFDPTHDRRVKDGYLTVAVGRDYSDVPPTSGTFSGIGPGELTVRKRLRSLPASELAELSSRGAWGRGSGAIRGRDFERI